MSEATTAIPIHHLKKGEKGYIDSLSGAAEEVSRMAALGLRKGAEISCIQKGTPCIVQFGASRMCLRTAGELQVMVSRI
ncbi:MAG: ferrous iron transport protein A [Pirellulaceae bacterium]|nr:ferrous iron transport protein A [Pirellulaceae bacterium]